MHQSPQEGPAGTTFTQSGAGFTANSTVTLYFYDQSGQAHTPQQYPTDGNGSFSINYTSSSGKPVGTYTWFAVDDTTGKYSEMLSYRITESGGVSSDISTGTGVPLPPRQWNKHFGELTSEGTFDPNRETFVIVHGWNRTDSTALPQWMINMGVSIRHSNDSPAKGSNVLFWNWQEKAKTDFSSHMPKDEFCTDVWTVPFNETKYSGIFLAQALKEQLPTGYNKKIHLIGHSLGTLVITYAARNAYDRDLEYAGNIDQLVYLDSPCYFGAPGKELLTSHPDIFFENYISLFGKYYKDADVNVWLSKAARSAGFLGGHGYAIDWYRSSVTNFGDKSILGDATVPSNTLHWGFYWQDAAHRSGVVKNYKQTSITPHYQLIVGRGGAGYGNNWGTGLLVDVGHCETRLGFAIWDQINDFVQWSGKKVSILKANTFNTLDSVANVITDMAGHAKYDSRGFLELIHSSTASMTIPVDIPPGANALTFDYEFLYGSSDSMLEVFINGKPLYHTSGEIALNEGMQLVPWLKVSEYAGTTANLTLRISHPETGAEGKIRVDNLVIARITSAAQFPWPMFMPAVTGAGK